MGKHLHMFYVLFLQFVKSQTSDGFRMARYERSRVQSASRSSSLSVQKKKKKTTNINKNMFKIIEKKYTKRREW